MLKICTSNTIIIRKQYFAGKVKGHENKNCSLIFFRRFIHFVKTACTKSKLCTKKKKYIYIYTHDIHNISFQYKYFCIIYWYR